MIVDLKKYLIIGAQQDLDEFFRRAQQQGFIEFLPEKGKKLLPPSEEMGLLLAGLKILRKIPEVQQVQGRLSLEEALDMAKKVKSLKEESEKCHEEIRVLRSEIVRVAPFGDFSLDDLAFLKEHAGRIVQFFCMKSAKRDLVLDIPELVYLSTEYDLDYYMSISTKPIHPAYMIEMKVEFSVSILKEQVAILEKRLRFLHEELKKSRGFQDALQDVLVDQLNDYHLSFAKNGVSYPLENSLFTIEAWVPETKISSLYAMLQGLICQAEPILVKKEESIPTCMENKGLGKIGEDIVLVYDTPAHSDKDPSKWVLWSFCAFFAMIINDAGYGLIFLLLSLLIRYKCPSIKGLGRRMLNLFTMLSVSCVIWGSLTTSYFGIDIVPSNPLSKISFVNYLAEKKVEYYRAQNDEAYQEMVKEYPEIKEAKTGKEMLQISVEEEGHKVHPVLFLLQGGIMLEISLLVGIIHLGLSLLRYFPRHWANLGWLIFLIGGYLYFPSVVKAVTIVNYMDWMVPQLAYAIGIEMIFIGIGAAMLLALIQKKMQGLTEVMNVIAVFADALSYLRLYALSLASTVMAETFNRLGVETGLVLGFLVILGGHGVNLLLGTMSGVIHGLRLNFLEWYHYSFQGGGKLFSPLHKIGKV